MHGICGLAGAVLPCVCGAADFDQRPDAFAGSPVERRFVVENWKTEQGMPQNWVECLLQTRDGYLWLGTRNGVSRFDGVRFTVFNEASHPGLALTSAKALAEDLAGNLWIGTKNGLLRYREGFFTRFTTQNGLAHNEVSKFLVDRDSSLWIGTGAGLSIFSGGTFRSYTNDAVQITHVYSLHETRDGRLLAGFLTGLFEFNPDSEKFQEVWPSPFKSSESWQHDPLTAIHEDRDGRIWIGTYRGRLYQAGPGATSWLDPNDSAETEVRQIFEESDGTLHVLAENALSRLSQGG